MANSRRRNAGNRRFEILLCAPGEPVELLPEPRHPADPNAIAVFSSRAVQIGDLRRDPGGLRLCRLRHRYLCPSNRGRGRQRSFEAVEYATLEWAGWFYHRRLLEPIGNIRPPKPKSNIALPRTRSIWQHNSQPRASGKPGPVHKVQPESA